MHILVCIKSVVMSAPKGKISRAPDNSILNPFDRPVIEMALRLKEAHDGVITALSMGPQTAEAALREAVAMGVDRAVLLCDRAFAGADTLATARVLAAAARHLAPFDLLLFGVQTADSDTGQVGPQTAVFLDLPLVTHVTRISAENDGITVERQMDGFLEAYALTLPAALTLHPAAVQPRDAALGALGTAFDPVHPITRLNIADIGLDPKQAGVFGSPTRVLSMKPVKKQRVCQWIEGDPTVQAEILTEKLVKAGLVA